MLRANFIRANRSRRWSMSGLATAVVAGSLLAAAIGSVGGAASAFDGATPLVNRAHRHPVDVIFGTRYVWVANRGTGTISVLDPRNRKVVDEHSVGKELTSLTTIAATGLLAVTDFHEHCLHVLQRDGSSIERRSKIPVARYPVDVAGSADGSRVVVASLWSRRLTILDRFGGGEFRVQRTADVPIAPGHVWLSPDGRRVVAADAFDGRLAVLDLGDGARPAVIRTQGHNQGGLATSSDGKRLLIPQQLLHQRVPTERPRVFWGNVLGNVLRGVAFDDLSSAPKTPGGSELGHWTLLPLGEPGKGAGDPAGLWVSPASGRAIVCLAGVDEVAVRSRRFESFVRVPVGRRPLTVAVDSNESLAVIVNNLDDSVSFLDLATQQVTQTLPLGRMPERTAAERGRRLFHSARLSLDGWFSCHSCHVDGHTSTLLNDNFGDETVGAPKRIPTLRGVAGTGPWAWNGKQRTLSEQIKKSLLTTMRDEKGHGTPGNVADLVAYLKTLRPVPSLAAARQVVAPAAVVEQGRRLFRDSGCVECHAGTHYTSDGVFDVELADEHGETRFNPPTLLGVSQRAPYFHDNRAATLADALKIHPPKRRSLTADQRRALLEFLRQL